MKTNNDPFNAAQRVKDDRTGLKFWDKEKTEEGILLFHTVVADRIIAIRMNGKVEIDFKKPENFSLYRPAKAAEKRTITCILISKKNSQKRSVASINEHGQILWRTRDHWLTHDFCIDDNNRIFSVMRRDKFINNNNLRISDNIVIEMDLDGKIVWEWSLLDNIFHFSNGKYLHELMLTYKNDNPFHVNSIQFNHSTYCYDMFNEPVIVISSRNMNKIFFLGRSSGKILFEFDDAIGQHHARILPKALSETNFISLIAFDNGRNFLPSHLSRNYSRIIEVNIENKEIIWEYKNVSTYPNFYSPIVGSQQRFENGNTLITEGYYGHIFEIDANGNVVYDFVFPDHNPLNFPNIDQTGLRQLYRAYKVNLDWLG